MSTMLTMLGWMLVAFALAGLVRSGVDVMRSLASGGGQWR